MGQNTPAILTNERGLQGSAGATGILGLTGILGYGITGIAGTQGVTGIAGLGNQGILGATGLATIAGHTGVQGLDGFDGIQGTADSIIWDAYNNAAGTAFTTGNQTLPLTTVRTSDSAFSLASSEVTCNTAGTYKITYDTSLYVSTGTSRSQAETWLEVNVTEVNGTRAQIYARTTTYGSATTASSYLSLSVNDVVRIRAARTQGTSTLQAPANCIRLVIEKADIVGPVGVTGLIGLTGIAGSYTGLRGNTGIQGSGSPTFPTTTEATATTTTTTTATTDTQTNSMTLTPVAGTYMVWFSGSVTDNTRGASIYTSIYSAGAQVAYSEQESNVGGDDVNTWIGVLPFTCIAKVTVNGAQAIEGRWRVSTGTGTMYERTLTLLRIS